MSDADALLAIEALCESAIGQDDEQSITLHEILRVCRKRKEQRTGGGLLRQIRLATDPKPNEDF